MFMQKKQALKRYTYLCLLFSSIMISSKIQAENKVSTDWVDYPVNGGHISVPRLWRNIGDEFEGPNLIGPNSKRFKHSEDEIQKALKSPPRGAEEQKSSQKYFDLKNKIIDKYEKQRPELARFRNSSSSKSHTPGLAAQARQFCLLSEALKREAEENNKKVTDLGKSLVSIIDTITEAEIEKRVKNGEVKSILKIVKNSIK